MPRSITQPDVDAARDAQDARACELVVIGGSAGGMEVINLLLAALPASFAPAVMIVMHLPPDPPSYLVHALAHRCGLPVIEPDAGEQIMPGRVHVAPPGYHMLVEVDRTVALSTDAAVRFSRPSIDVLFESAADVYREHLLALLLSGANDDGVNGLQRVRALGGVAWVQDPATAMSSEMPRTAIERGAADYIYSPETMARRLAAWPASL
ncbi:CheB methylesterase [Paraburkholderia sp. GV068]|jgi:two-component system chemotaxis response regulator CheB|uniref:protein-glutamate methylesterase n=1 Tax=Paraburkholderia graminis (strain ATCC 700544 / DSM 17151 / LMG 18924 / NCIMB 13744 / C4D1M) TaxID=396598 RepID=B1FTQ2_PARG4|nr:MULTISPECIES: chemotaxis protein CheB [Paraburkholderia]EDT13060.1 CheB methylesterase [Paraburkholderia graminis C4D1M]MDR6476020.1 two-component system chemotaxis response regulator CheB [Paraburkholderia graminis]PTQ95365.1 CheB methylesterase [Paraburkholderia sp. GV072]PUB02019.1 CheB methylesterase [Paraburkholderia sp. GV068]CAB3718176.1 Protein-glutamate methylesterase/protein-glutamine glutaminase [Paraburkholderia graminis C4D1M]